MRSAKGYNPNDTLDDRFVCHQVNKDDAEENTLSVLTTKAHQRSKDVAFARTVNVLDGQLVISRCLGDLELANLGFDLLHLARIGLNPWVGKHPLPLANEIGTDVTQIFEE